MSKPENTECTSQSAANPHPGLPVCKIEANNVSTVENLLMGEAEEAATLE